MKIYKNILMFYQSGISDIVNIAAISITGFLATTALYKFYKNKLLLIVILILQIIDKSIFIQFNI